jgi:PTS system fructose-specific IIA component/PTS system nitrogen regulatory IIA component
MIADMFSKERVCFELKSGSKDEVLSELIDILAADGKVNDKDKFKDAVLHREEEFSTGIGMGIAIPHGKSDAVTEASIAFGKSTKGIDFDSMDGEPAHFFFLLAIPTESNDIHLRALSEIARKLMHADVRERLLKADNFEEFIEVFN